MPEREAERTLIDMKEHIELITRIAEEMYNLTKLKYTASREEIQLWRDLAKEIGEELDELDKELPPWE